MNYVLCLAFDDWKKQMGRIRAIMVDAVNRWLVLIGCLARDVPTDVAVAVEARKIAARNLQPDTVAR